MIYDRMDGNNFKITLKLYRDCGNPDAADFDDPLFIYAYNASGILVDSIMIYFPGADEIDPSLVTPCISVSPDLCVQEGVYEGYIELPPSIGGYDLVYQRCCRNTTILNIYNPAESGATYTVHIPDPGAINNSSPRFNLLPPVTICAAFPFAFDHSATDPDGDELVYRFFTPLLGASFDAPLPVPALPPPYAEVSFSPPYSEAYQIASSPAFSLDPVTGWLAGTPTDLGQFVVGIAVEEYRAGVLIGVHYRDFQFNATDCVPNIVAAAPAEISECTGFTVLFDNYSLGTDEFIWDFGVDGITTDVSTDEIPTYTYPDTGTYQVQLIAFPGYDCSDTTYITVYVYPELIPEIIFDNACAGAPVNFIDATTTTYGTLETCEWNYGDGWGSTEQNPVYAYDEAGNYMLIFTVTNSFGCTAQIYDTISIYPNPYAFVATDTACLNTSTTIEDGSVVLAGNSIIDWQWTIDGVAAENAESIEWTFNTPGTYDVTLTVTTDKGCTSTISDSLIVPDQIVAGVLDDYLVCEGDTITLTATGGNQYTWFPVDGVSDPDAATTAIIPDVSQQYMVIVSDGCTFDTAYTNIEVLPAPEMTAGPDTTIYHGQTVTLYATGAESYVWTPEGGLSDPLISNPVATPDLTTAYLVTGTGANGCSATGTAFITVLPVCQVFSTVNAFSPNNDGINDLFRLHTSGDDALVSMEIFNRWGQRVFYTNSLEFGWDGTDGNGVAQEVGAYVYIIYTACDGIEQQLSGMVTLLR